MVGEASHNRRIDACRRGGGRWACGDPRRIWRREAVLRQVSTAEASARRGTGRAPGAGHAYPFAGEVAVMTAPSCRERSSRPNEGGPKADSVGSGPVEASGPTRRVPARYGQPIEGRSHLDDWVTQPETKKIDRPANRRGPGAGGTCGHRPSEVIPPPPPAPGPQPVVPDPPRRTGTTPSGRAATPR